jgi:hypothetical protein
MTTIDSQKIVIELKAVASELGACEEQQLRNYMKILGVECGLPIQLPDARAKARKDATLNP